ncbi:sperm flagellar protein 1-like isoform X8 [Mercenaria mercenaria]|uniref:sperm flagellar protein 1-like isoform X8 n=1 Tax=Mercenaria mercenaria TaxID=6596 RepID=UPI00234F736E|nr:sperm flagellar protein 1-like isoform X8 [Mercenaria mercenaria]
MATKTKGGKSSSHSHDHHHEGHEKMEEPLDEQELESLYAWVDSIPLSRPKRNISRDFSDGVLVAECIKHFFPDDGLVDLHSYTTANATNKKKENWYYLNRKVFAKMNFELAEDVINDLCCCKPGMIEKVLLMLQVKIKRAEYARGRQSDKPEADQHQMTPGRKDSRMVKVGLEDTKGSRFVKTKQYQKDIENVVDDYGHLITHRYLDNRGWNSGVEHIPPRQRNKLPFMETDVVPRIMLEEREQEVLAKDEMTKILLEKVKRMEHLLQLKDIRIAELTERTEPTGYAQVHGSHHKPTAQSHSSHHAAQAHGVFYKPAKYQQRH